MVMSRSPYYALVNSENTQSNVTGAEFNINLTVEDRFPIVSDIEYTITKNIVGDPTIAGQALSSLDISPFVRELFTFQPIYSSSTQLLNSNEGNIVACELDVNQTNNVSIFQTTLFATYGYSEFKEGLNADLPSNGGILLSNDFYVAEKSGHFNVPIINNGNFGTNISILGGQVFTLTQSTSNLSTYIKNLFLDLSNYDEGDIVTVIGGGRTIRILVKEECKFENKDIIFLNKFGAWEIMSFSRQNEESLRVTSEDFKVNLFNGAGYSTTEAQNQKFNTNGTAKIKLKTQYLPEESNETVRQLMLSEHVFLLNAGDFIPLKCTETSKTFKTRINDKVIQHEMEFEYANDFINNI